MPRLALPLLFFILTVSIQADTLDRLAGRYRGCAVSAGEWVPIETTLAVSGGGLSGTYLFIESNGRTVAGSIAPNGAPAGDSIALRWSDLYGEGPALFRFSADGARFDGYWTTDTGEDRFAWYGVRADSDLPAPDCRVPVS